MSAMLPCILCPLQTGIRPVLVLYFLAFVTAFRHAATASEGAASICRLCPFLWYWFGDTAFGPPAIDCGPCHEVWPSGLSCSGSCRQLVDLNCPHAPRLPLRIPRLDRPLCLAPVGEPSSYACAAVAGSSAWSRLVALPLLVVFRLCRAMSALPLPLLGHLP